MERGVAKRLKAVFLIVGFLAVSSVIGTYAYKIHTYDVVEASLDRFEVEDSNKRMMFRPVYSYSYDSQAYEYQTPYLTSQKSAQLKIELLIHPDKPFDPTQKQILFPLVYSLVAVFIVFVTFKLAVGIYIMRKEPFSLTGEETTSWSSIWVGLKKYVKKQPVLIVFICIFVLVQGFILGAYMLKSFTYDIVDGVVVRHEVSPFNSTIDTQSYNYRPIYSYTYDGVGYEYVSSDAGSRGGQPKQSIGTIEKLFVNPHEPTDASYASLRTVLFKMFLLCIVGIILLGWYYLHPLAMLYTILGTILSLLIKESGLIKKKKD